MDTAKGMVKTTFCLVSDTHDRAPKPTSEDRFAFRDPLPPADVLLHAGDLTMSGGIKEHGKVVEWIKNADAELKIVIAGNHDVDLHAEHYLRYPEEDELEDQWKRIDAVKELWTGPAAKEAGLIYLDEGLNTFTLKSGATFTVCGALIEILGCQLTAPRSTRRPGSQSSMTGLSTTLVTSIASTLPFHLRSRLPPIPSLHGRPSISCSHTGHPCTSWTKRREAKKSVVNIY